MCFGFDSQGAWVPHSVYWFTWDPHWFMPADHQDWTGEYFTAKYLNSTIQASDLGACLLEIQDSGIGFQTNSILRSPTTFLLLSWVGSLANIAAPWWLAEVSEPYGEGIKRGEWLWLDGSGLMQPLWAPQPNIYNSGITRGGPEAGGDPNGSITANRSASHCYQTIDNRQPTKPGEWGRNKDTQDKKA